VASLAVPLALRELVNFFLGSGTGRGQTFLIGVLVLALGISAVAEGFRTHWSLKAESLAASSLQSKLAKSIIGKNIGFFSKNETGTLVSVVLNDIASLVGIFGATITLFTAGAAVVFSLVILAILDLSLALVMVATIAIAVLLVVPIAVLSGIAKSRLLRAIASTESVLYRVFMNIRLIKANVTEHHETERIESSVLNLRNSAVKISALSSSIAPVILIAFSGGLILLALYGSSRVAEGTLTGGTLAAFFAYIAGLIPPLFQIGDSITRLKMAVASSATIFRILGPVDDDGAKAIMFSVGEKIVPESGPLSIRGLKVKYLEESTPALVLEHIDVSTSQFLSLVGPNGSGKSTLMAAILRLQEIEPAMISWGGQSILNYDLTSWRRSISYASPTATLLPGTIRQNLVYGCTSSVSDAQIWRALEDVDAATFVQARTEGLDCEIDDYGGGISSGQAQRLALARVILQNRAFVLLDEATSHLDQAGSLAVLKNIRRRLSSATILMATHRPAEAALADIEHRLTAQFGNGNTLE
jgi:ATP-binding cassette, subfamily B, bacterial AbcA/BmrA